MLEGQQYPHRQAPKYLGIRREELILMLSMMDEEILFKFEMDKFFKDYGDQFEVFYKQVESKGEKRRSAEKPLIPRRELATHRI